MGAKYIGASVPRREDPRLLMGDGRYVADVRLPGLLHAVFLRSPHAHALIKSIDASAALKLNGVTAVFTFDNLSRWMKPLPVFGATPPGLAQRVNVVQKQTPIYPLCHGRARYVGEAVAVIVAASRELAEDAADLVEIDYETLPAAIDVVAAGEPGAPLLHPEWGDNLAVSFTLRIGDADAAFREADATVRQRFDVQRYVGMPIETRGVVASYDRRDETLTSWSATQIVHFNQEAIAAVMGMPVHKVRVIAPDVGGGFGTKANGYAEDIVIPVIARELGRPVKWIEDRHEHMTASAHARGQVHDIALAAKRDGTFLAVSDNIWVDFGAYNCWGVVLPYNTLAHLMGPYRIPNLAASVKAPVTNKTPNAPYRGAGRPETVFAMDRIVDCLAREIGMDAAEIRRRNFIREDEMPYELNMPYRDGNPLVYDSGNFPEVLDTALKTAGYDGFRVAQAKLRQQGVYRGIGLSGYVEGTGIGPFEGASVKVDLSGRVLVATGACSQGQAHETSFAQIAADALGVPIDWVSVIGGDTQAIAIGMGTYASRSMVTAGASLAYAAREVRSKLIDAAAGLMEAAAGDLTIEDGRIKVQGAPNSGMDIAQVVKACIPTFAAEGPAPPVFESVSYHHVPTVTYASAVHVAEVEVDPETGGVKLLRYVVAHDCGKMINPVVVDGQVHGGVCQGIGGALFEEMLYDDSGQLLTGSLMDYLAPTSAEMPDLETVHLEFPSPRNPLGVKGLGEGGAISPPAAIANAVEDALAPFGIRITKTPITPDSIIQLLEAQREA